MKNFLRTAGAAALSAPIAMAGFTNGGFETGNFTGWTLEYGTISAASPCDMTLTWSTVLPGGHPAPAVISASDAPAGGQPIDVDPYCDSYAARINDLIGGYHATRLRQSFVVSAAEACPLPNAQHVDVTWGAMIQDGGHCPGQQAWFSIDVQVNGSSVSLTRVDATAAAAAGSGWVFVGGSDWYKQKSTSVPFYAAAGDTVEVILTAYDCAGSAHGGMAFLDCVDFSCGPTCGPDPIAFYKFDNPGNFGLDDTGNGHQGVSGAAGVLPSECGFAAGFLPDNNVHEFTIPHAADLDLTGPMTGMAMIRPRGQQSPDGNPSCTEGTIFAKGGNYWFQVEKNNDRLVFQNEGSGSDLAIGYYRFCLDRWTHVAFVRENDGRTIRFYVNGVQLPTTTTLANFASPNADPVMVGNYGFGNDPGACEFNGDIDEIRIYDRALSSDELMAAYLCGCPNVPCELPPIISFCEPGQGGVLACPCSNPPTAPGHGCNNFGAGPADSAKLTGSGEPSVSADTCTLIVTGENNTSTTILLQSPSSSSTGLVFGAGIRCLTGSLKRLYTGPASAGTIARPQGADPDIHTRSAALGDPLAPGSIRYYMAYYRDPSAAGPCGNAAATFNCSNSGQIVWQP